MEMQCNGRFYYLLWCKLPNNIFAEFPFGFFSALTLLAGRQEGNLACKKWGMGRWALVSPDGVAPSRIVSVSACANLPLHHKVQKFSSGTGLPRWSRKKGCKTVVVVVPFGF